MNIRIILVFISVFTVYTANSAESFNKILKKNVSARGGAEIIKNLQTYIIGGELIREDSIVFHFRAAFKNPNKMVVEYYQNNDTVAVGYNGLKAWTIMPQISSFSIEIPNSAAEEAIALTVSPILKYFNHLDYLQSLNSKVIVTDTDSIDSLPHFKLVSTRIKNEPIDTVYVNKSTYLISQVNTMYKVAGKHLPVKIEIGDYKLSNELNAPYYVKITNDKSAIVELKLSYLQVNPELEDIIFEMPK